jgi:uncharacterized membrane protein YtjA (UPF0391 family)
MSSGCERIMLHYAVVCLVAAILAAMFGFSGIPVVAAGVARIIFFMFVALFLVTLAAGVVGRRG